MSIYNIEPTPEKTIMVSSRKYSQHGGTVDSLLKQYQQFETSTMKIKNVYGFCGEECRMFGGRAKNSVHTPALMSWDEVSQFNQRNITFSLTLSNHFIDDEAVASSFPIIEKLISLSEKNSVIVLNRTYAKILRKTFPTLIMKQSTIANPRTISSIERALETYDLVTLNHNMLDEREFILSLPLEIKKKLVLFASSICEFRCPEKKVCYTGNSQSQFGLPRTYWCTSSHRKDGITGPMTFFNLKDPIYKDIQYIKFTEIPLDQDIS